VVDRLAIYYSKRAKGSIGSLKKNDYRPNKENIGFINIEAY
jgi:hypothetical protein